MAVEENEYAVQLAGGARYIQGATAVYLMGLAGKPNWFQQLHTELGRLTCSRTKITN